MSWSLNLVMLQCQKLVSFLIKVEQGGFHGKAAETEEFEEYRRRCHLETEHQACHAWSILSDCLSLSLPPSLSTKYLTIYIYIYVIFKHIYIQYIFTYLYTYVYIYIFICSYVDIFIYLYLRIGRLVRRRLQSQLFISSAAAASLLHSNLQG